MIYFYSGTPGSGKSLRVARDIVAKIRIRKQDVITNMSVNYDYISTSKLKHRLNKFFAFLRLKFRLDSKIKGVGNLVHFPNDKLTAAALFEYAYENHSKGQEGQTLLVLDEAQMLFGPTVVKLRCQENKSYRVDWLDFFTQHRHLGYNVILISQFDRLIDPQIRCLFEYNYIHRKINNFKFGKLLSLFKISLFISSEYWYGVKEKTGLTFFTYKKKYSKIYDSYSRWDIFMQQKEQKDLEEQKDFKKIFRDEGKVILAPCSRQKKCEA